MSQLTYAYKALDSQGSRKSGVLQAENQSEAYRQLTAAGLKPLSRRYRVAPLVVQGVEDNAVSGASLLRHDSARASITAVKRHEERDTLVVRLYNLTGAAVHAALVNLGEYEALEGVMRVDFSGDSRSPHVSQIRMIQGGPDAFNVILDWTETPDLRPADNFSNQ